MKLTYDRLREITERAENAIDEETYLRPELEEVLEEMTECWAENERLKEEIQRLRGLYEEEREIAEQFQNKSFGSNEKLQDALNTLQQIADFPVINPSGLIKTINNYAKEAIDRLKGQEVMNKVYIIMWYDSFDDWEIKKVFSTKEKAQEFLKDKNYNSYGMFEMEVES